MSRILKTALIAVFTVIFVVFVSSCGKKDEGSTAEKQETQITNNETESNGTESNEETAKVGENEEENEEAVAGSKFDQKLQEAIEHAEKGGVNPNFAVDAILTGNYTDAMVSNLQDKGVDVVYGDKNTMRIVVSPKVLQEIQDISFIKKFVLITENYYPNR